MTPRPRAAATAWILGAAAYLGAEAASASAYRPSYSYAHAYISDLGVPGQPLAALMNVGFAVQGALFLLGAVLASGSRHPVLASFAAANAVGNVLVGMVHTGDGTLHLAGAQLLPAPVWERASVYPILAWQVFAALAILLALLPARRQHP